MAASPRAARIRRPNPVGGDTLAVAADLRAFLGNHAVVHLWEGGRRIARLAAEHSGFSISTETGRLVCHFWSPDANLVRRVVGLHSVAPGRLRLTCLRLGQSQPSPLVLEADDAPAADDKVAREEFRQAVLAAAQRDWRGWTYASAGTETLLGGTLRSGAVRLLFRCGRSLLPCVAVDEGESAGTLAGALAQALVWAQAAGSRHPADALAAVRLVLPPGAEDLVAARTRWMLAPPRAPAIEIFRLDRSAGQLNPVPLAGRGNIVSSLRRAVPTPSAETAWDREAVALLTEIREICPQTTLERAPDGSRLFRLYGLEIVRQAPGAEALAAPFTFGYGREQTPLLPTMRAQFAQFLRALADQRVPGGDRRHPLYSLQPERWLEHLLRSDLSSLDPQLDRRYVYAQVPVCGWGARDLLDLLAVDREGRLLVLELKTDEDLGFPLQALDYWARVRHHQLAGDFERLGYFPGIALSPLPPRLWLVAPALRWHPQTPIVTRWISPDIPWAQIGINEEWRHGIQVVYRKEASHG